MIRAASERSVTGTDCAEEEKIDATDLYIIYLDFDGVLHDDAAYWRPKKGLYIDMPGRTLFEWAPILVRLLAPYPNVKIVLSTSWVRVRSFEFAVSHLPASLASRVIGATFHSQYMLRPDFEILPRGMQVLSDVGRRRPKGWFAIDNDDCGWGAAIGSLVKTEDGTGILPAAAQGAIRAMLQSFPNNDGLH